jgi:hypothetical protein
MSRDNMGVICSNCGQDIPGHICHCRNNELLCVLCACKQALKDSVQDCANCDCSTPCSECPKTAEPENNDGRATCYWCGSPTKKFIALKYNEFYDVCINEKCGR